MADDNDLIAAIYDAAINPLGWDEVVKRIAEATKSVSGGLSVQLSNTLHLSALHNIDPYYANMNIQTLYKDNPLSQLMHTLVPGTLWTATEITQNESFKASAYYNEYIRPQGWADAVAIGLVRAPEAVGFLAFQRSHVETWIEPPEWSLLKTLAPHLQRAAELHQLIASSRSTTDSLAAAVGAAGFAVFLLTGDCRVAFANARAEDLVRCGAGLRYERGRLAAATTSLTHRLHVLAREAARPRRSEGDVGGTIELPRAGLPPLIAHIIPLAANRAVTIFDFDRPACAVFVVDPAAGFGAKIQHFARRYALTQAEARVLAEIIGGNGLLAAATRLNITEATARTHAKRIFEKTETHRQPELIRRFFETALPGSPGAP